MKSFTTHPLELSKPLWQASLLPFLSGADIHCLMQCSKYTQQLCIDENSPSFTNNLLCMPDSSSPVFTIKFFRSEFESPSSFNLFELTSSGKIVTSSYVCGGRSFGAFYFDANILIKDTFRILPDSRLKGCFSSFVTDHAGVIGIGCYKAPQIIDQPKSTISLYDLKKGDLKIIDTTNDLSKHDDPKTKVELSAKGDVAILFSWGTHYLKGWRLKGIEKVTPFICETEEKKTYTCGSLAKSGKKVVAATQNSIWVWNLDHPSAIEDKSEPLYFKPCYKIGNELVPKSISLSWSGELLSLGCRNGLSIFTLSTQGGKLMIKIKDEPIHQCKMASNEKTVAFTTKDKDPGKRNRYIFQVWSIADTPKLLDAFPIYGKQFAATSSLKSVSFFDYVKRTLRTIEYQGLNEPTVKPDEQKRKSHCIIS